MDLLNKAEEIAMTNLSILYNINPIPFTICVMPLLVEPKQQQLDVVELQEEDTYVPARRKKKERKVVRGVVTRKVSMKTSSGILLIPRSYQFCVARKSRMVNDEQCSSDVST
jgi:hypothetical protein